MPKALLGLIGAVILIAGYYVMARGDQPSGAASGIVDESAAFAPMGRGEGAVISVSDGSISLSMSGVERVFSLRPETVIFKTSNVRASDLIKGESALVALRPGTREVFAVTVFKDQSEVPVGQDNAEDFFFGTIEDVLSNTAKLRDSKGEIKLVILNEGLSIKKIERIEPGALAEGDIAKVDWHTRSNEVIAAAIFLEK